MPTSNYNTGFPQGVTIRNVPVLDLQNGDGNVFWVNSVTGSNDNKGTFKYPLKSLLKALTLVKADQGDKIFLAAGHEETISDATTYHITTPGIQIFGMGTGSNRPIFEFTGAATTHFRITATDVYMSNVIFVPNLADLDVFLTITGNRTILENCKFECLDIVEKPIKAHGYDIKFIDCEIHTHDSLSSSPSGIEVFGNSNNMQIINCIMRGLYSEGCITLTNVDVTNLFIDGGSYRNTSAGGFVIHSSATASSSGIVGKNVNMEVNNSLKLPIYSENNAKIGQDNLGDVTSITTVVNVSKIIGSSAYLLDVQNGAFLIEEASWQTDATTLGGATNVNMTADDNDYGNSKFFEELVSNLPGRTTVTLEDASIAGLKTTLQTDGKIQVNATGGTLTGNDSRLTFRLRSLESGSNIIKNPSF